MQPDVLSEFTGRFLDLLNEFATRGLDWDSHVKREFIRTEPIRGSDGLMYATRRKGPTLTITCRAVIRDEGEEPRNTLATNNQVMAGDAAGSWDITPISYKGSNE